MGFKPLSVMIVGAGVSGSVLGHILSQEPGIVVTVIERAQRADQSDAGTGLNLGPNGLKALAEAAPALHDQVRAVSLPWWHWRVALTDGTPLMDLPLQELADRPGIRIRWSALYELLRQSVGDGLEYASTVRAMRYAPDRRSLSAVVRGQRCRVVDGIDLLVGGDGRYSRVRETFLAPPTPRQLGVCIFRLLLPDGSGGLIDDYTQWFNGSNRLLAFRVPGDGAYIAGAFPIPDGGEVPDGMKTAAAFETLYRPARGLACPAVDWMLRQLTGSIGDIHWARAQEIDMAFRDAHGRVLLLGDAAHAMVPTLGQGATTAMEDACFAGHAIRRAARQARALDRPVDVPAVLAEIEAMRRPRVCYVMDLSIDASDTIRPGADPVSGTLRKTAPAFRERLRRLYCDTPDCRDQEATSRPNARSAARSSGTTG